MCVYSVISDWGNQWIPRKPSPIPYPGNPNVTPSPWTQPMLDEWRDILARVKKLEERLMELGEQVECVEDPSKQDYLDEIQALLDKAKAARESPG